HLAASQRMDATMSRRGEPERVRAARVTANYFQVLGLRPEIGRAFGSGEDGIVLTHALWQRKFSGDKSVLGSSLNLDGVTGTILGVMPPEASLAPRGAELWTSMEKALPPLYRGRHVIRVLGRLRRGASVGQASAEISGIMGQLEQEYPKDNLG